MTSTFKSCLFFCFSTLSGYGLAAGAQAAAEPSPRELSPCATASAKRIALTVSSGRLSPNGGELAPLRGFNQLYDEFRNSTSATSQDERTSDFGKKLTEAARISRLLQKQSYSCKRNEKSFPEDAQSGICTKSIDGHETFYDLSDYKTLTFELNAMLGDISPNIPAEFRTAAKAHAESPQVAKENAAKALDNIHHSTSRLSEIEYVVSKATPQNVESLEKACLANPDKGTVKFLEKYFAQRAVRPPSGAFTTEPTR